MKEEYKLSDYIEQNGRIGIFSDADFKKMSYKRRVELKQKNPREYERLAQRENRKG